jgi:hypothetical protein
VRHPEEQHKADWLSAHRHDIHHLDQAFWEHQKASYIEGLRGLVWANSGWKADKRGHLNVDDGEDCAGRSWLPRSTAALIACMLGLPNVLGCQGL